MLPCYMRAWSSRTKTDEALDIEKSLTVNKGDDKVEEWLDVGNGCICCSVKYAVLRTADPWTKADCF